MPWMIRGAHLRILVRAAAGALLLTIAASARAQEPAAEPPQPTDDAQPPAAAADTSAESKNRIFGLMPNYTTVEGFGKVEPITSAKSFKMAALDSFDPFVYPLFGFVAATAQVQNERSESVV